MSVLADLHTAALATDSETGWMLFYKTFAGTQLVVPLERAAGETAAPLLTRHQGVETVQAYPDMLSFADALSDPGSYAEMPGADLASMLAEEGVPLVIHDTTEVLLAPDQLAWIARTYGAEVTRATGAGVTIATPAAPELALMEALGQTVGALGSDCPEAWLVEMTEPDGTPELVLVLGLSDAVKTAEAQIAETVTRAIQSVTDRPFAVACSDRGAPLMASARQHGIGIGG